MPKATTNVNDTERHDLNTCEEGFVVLRRLNYGEMLERRTLAGKLNFAGKPGEKDVNAYINMANRIVTEFEFKNCIVDHNLENENGQPLDFRSAATITMLDPRIGDEISALIDGMNQAEASLPNSVSGSKTS